MKWIKQFGLLEWVTIALAAIAISLIITWIIHIRVNELRCWEYRGMNYGDIPITCVDFVARW